MDQGARAILNQDERPPIVSTIEWLTNVPLEVTHVNVSIVDVGDISSS